MVSPTSTSSASSNEAILEGSSSRKALKDTFITRPLRLSDIAILGEYSRRAYWLSPMNNFLFPRAPECSEQLERNFRQGIRRRYVNPTSLSIVACPVDNPDTPVGYSQSFRIGDDQGLRNSVYRKGFAMRLLLYVLSWIFWAYDKVDEWIFPDKISDLQNLKTFDTWMAQDKAKYWTPYSERNNRWHCSSVIVSPDYQGKGVGRLLMKEVLERAQNERVPCGLTASAHGEILYRKLGFEYLGDFCHRVEEETEEENAGGGIMCWWPDGWEGARAD